jgi:DNA mismatch repair protein MutL
MNRVRLLPEQVANQIAAGEVVERPASVVKELVENSLDAQATQITVEIQAGGRSLIRVTDDGMGMNRDDALLCLERHATSKIRRAEDLAAISSMGFRGEALPSIASVSRFTLTTRERDGQSAEGVRVVIVGGRILEVKAAGTAPGTSVEVRQLFFNLPARRKFLRTIETESAHVTHYLTLAALAFPEVAFTFSRDGRVVWQLPGIKAGETDTSRLASLKERLRNVYGAEQALLEVNFRRQMNWIETADLESDLEAVKPASSEVRVWGFVGAPGVSRSTREDQHLFVNRRPVENRGLNYALLEGYHTSLMKGRYPVCCLFVEIDPSEVDVNIHPAKREVKFHREMEVRRTVAEAVRQTLLAFHGKNAHAHTQIADGRGGLSSLTQNAPAPGIPQENARQSSASVTVESDRESQGTLPNLPAPLRPGPPPTEPARQASLQMGFAAAPVSPRPVVSPEQGSSTVAVAAKGQASAPGEPRVSGTNLPLFDVPLRLVGVVGKLYVVLESDRGLVLLDQHAAHERILFEQMLNRLEQKEQAPSQRLLLPETVELAPRDASFLRQQLPALVRLGVGLSEFGESTFLLDALPPFVKVTEPRRFVLELVDQLKAAGAEVNSLRLGEHVVAKTVCRHAVKANDPLAGAELENLLNDLRQCAMPYTCPHGRPTILEMNYRELERKFGRQQ